jgi:hypothetical protein
MAQWVLLETLMWVNIQRITGVAHCANVVWPDLEQAAYVLMGQYCMGEVARSEVLPDFEVSVGTIFPH